MSIFNWSKLVEVEKTDLELQSELKALVNRIVVEQLPGNSELRRYEKLLAEIYKRRLEPEISLKIKK